MTQENPRDPLLDLQVQVAALHRAVAAQRTLIFGLGFGLVAALACNLLANVGAARAWAQEKGAMDISCRTLKIVDDTGKVRLQLFHDKAGGVLRLNNADGKTVAALEADNAGGFLSVLGHDGKERAFVGVGDKLAGGLFYLKNHQGKTRATYLVSKDGNGALELINSDDKVEIFLGSSSQSRGGLVHINAPAGTASIILDIDERGMGRLNLRTKDGKRVAYAGGDEEGGTFQLYGHDGKQRAFLGVGEKQTGGVLYLLNPDNNNPRIVLGVDNNGVGYGEGRDASGATKRALR